MVLDQASLAASGVIPFPSRIVKRMSCIRVQIEVDAFLVFC